MVDATLYKEVMGRFATGVTVVTVADGTGGIVGFTANAFSAVSLKPPLVLVCLSNDSECYEPLRTVGRFTIHFLGNGQTQLALAFADRTLDKSKQARWSFNGNGYPVLAGALAAIECRLHEQHKGGDHGIFIGAVEAMRLLDSSASPLLYYRGKLGGKEII